MQLVTFPWQPMLVISKLERPPVGSSYGVADKVNAPCVKSCALHFSLFKFLKSRTSRAAEKVSVHARTQKVL